jgi:hypothetical protein
MRRIDSGMSLKIKILLINYLDELIAIQAAAAMEEGLVSPAHLLIDTFPSEQGSQRVTDATTLYKAQKKRSRSSSTLSSSVAAGRRPANATLKT